MVQNNNGVYALKIDSDNQTINASDIQMGSAESDKLANFNNCKVWLESTNADRITTAKMAVTTINSIEITDIHPLRGNHHTQMPFYIQSSYTIVDVNRGHTMLCILCGIYFSITKG